MPLKIIDMLHINSSLRERGRDAQITSISETDSLQFKVHERGILLGIDAIYRLQPLPLLAQSMGICLNKF